MNGHHTHSDTYMQDLLWPFVVLIGWSEADVIIVEQSATWRFQVVGQSFGRISSSFRAEVMPQGYVMCLCVLVQMCVCLFVCAGDLCTLKTTLSNGSPALRTGLLRPNNYPRLFLCTQWGTFPLCTCLTWEPGNKLLSATGSSVIKMVAIPQIAKTSVGAAASSQDPGENSASVCLSGKINLNDAK